MLLFVRKLPAIFLQQFIMSHDIFPTMYLHYLQNVFGSMESKHLFSQTYVCQKIIETFERNIVGLAFGMLTVKIFSFAETYFGTYIIMYARRIVVAVKFARIVKRNLFVMLAVFHAQTMQSALHTSDKSLLTAHCLAETFV